MDAIKDVIPAVLTRLQDPETARKNALFLQWPQIVGPRLATHTKPSLGRNGILFIWVDQATLAYEINQKYRPSILKRVEAAVGEGVVKTIRIRVGQLRY